MNDLTIPVQTMSSLEIANLVDSRHDKVRQSIERLAERGVVTLPPMGKVSNDGPGPKTIAVYLVSKRDSYVIVAQLSPEFTARLVDRWQELEAAPTDPLAVLADPAALRTLLLGYTERVQTLEAANTAMLPKVEGLRRIAEADGSQTITDAAKVLQLPPGQLFKLLQERQWIYRRGNAWTAFQRAIESGHMEQKISTGERDGKTWTAVQPRLTAKGIARLSIVLSTPQQNNLALSA